MVYVILMYILPCLLVTSLFLRTHKSTRYRYEKAIFVPFEPIKSFENLHMARTDLELVKCVPNSCICPGPSFIDEYNCGRVEKSFANF